MKSKRDYLAGRRERLPLLLELYGLGINQAWYCRYTGHNPITIRKDLESEGIRREEAPDKEVIFGNVLRRYAVLMVGGGDADVIKALEAWLDVENIHRYLEGMEAAMSRLATIPYPPGMEGEARLLEAVFDPESYMTGLGKVSLFEDPFWKRYLAGISSGRIAVPSSREALDASLAEEYLANRWKHIRPRWPGDARERINRVMETLTPREQYTLKHRFGLEGNQPKKLEEVGALEGLTRERVRQIEAKALRLLRHPVRSKELKSLYYIPAPEAPPPLIGSGKESNGEGEVATLAKSVDELELSVRSANSLINAKVEYVYELVQKTEVELLKTKNFGRKSLKEIKEILEQLGLTLGMKLEPEVISQVLSHIQNKTPVS